MAVTPGRSVFAGSVFAESVFVGSVDAESGDADVLTLTDAQRLAEAANPALRRARVQALEAAELRLTAWGELLPSVAAATEFSVIRTRRSTSTDVFGDPTGRDDAVSATTRSVFQGLELHAKLFDGGAGIAALRAAGARARAALAGVEAEQVRVWTEVGLAYFDVLEGRQAFDVERALLEARGRDVETIERLFGVAAADRIDVLGAHIELVRQEARTAEAAAEAQAKSFELMRAVGTSFEPDIVVVVPFAPFDPACLIVEDLIQGALVEHPTLVAGESELAAARGLEAATGWLSYLPSVETRASYTRSEFGGAEAPFFNLDPRDSTWGFGLALAFPFLDRARRRSEGARVQAARISAEEALRTRRLDAEVDIRRGLLDLESAYRRLTVGEKATQWARERAELAREMHAFGAIDFARLEGALDEATLYERELVRHRFDYYRALTVLAEVVGRPIAPPISGAGSAACPDS